MAASSCRRPRLRYSITLASPCMSQISASTRSRLPVVEQECLEKTGATRGHRPQTPARSLAVPAFRATGTGLIDNAADRARATAALGAAAEAAIDLARGARCLAAIERRADVLIAQHVARTDDHGDVGSWAVVSSLCNYRYMRPRRQAKTKRRFFSYSNVRCARARDRRASSRFSQAAATG